MMLGLVLGKGGGAIGCLEAGLSLHEAWRVLSHASIIISKGLTDHWHVHLHSCHSLVLACHQLLDTSLLERVNCTERAQGAITQVMFFSGTPQTMALRNR